MYMCWQVENTKWIFEFIVVKKIYILERKTLSDILVNRQNSDELRLFKGNLTLNAH